MCVSERYFDMTNPFTLNNLYSHGIIDYVPYDLCNGVNVSSGIANPYLQSAMQGSLYQNHGMYGDSFTYSSPFGMQQLAVNSQAGKNAWGMQGIGTESSAGLNAFGLGGIGTNSQAGVNAWGGFNDVGGNVSAHLDGTLSFFDRIPKAVKGIAAGLLMIGSLALVFRGKKKPPVQKTSFFSKLNPVNWFKKTKV